MRVEGSGDSGGMSYQVSRLADPPRVVAGRHGRSTFRCSQRDPQQPMSRFAACAWGSIGQTRFGW